MATNEIQNGCGSSIEAVLASNQKRRRVLLPQNLVWAGLHGSDTHRPLSSNIQDDKFLLRHLAQA